ncbi:HAD-IIIA family hydrolase [Aurantibacter crassamenti]|uniref:KdsC family phosphatase n=1 Tax=Aurantibacter crassamenti TaxID=1837375 RepID=UPI00193A9F98|nr:HAD-IIIA family hydrolase [Aurantibacter crassamenti]MBM1106865.1 HAD-IIIA family hydrolase [Aurantibacter crassamenti]
MDKSYKASLNNITTFVFDVDGVLTDGSVFITNEGELLRSMNVKDGYALKTAVKKGYNVCIITGGNNNGVKIRLQGLGITNFYMNAHLKAEHLDEYLNNHNIEPENVLFMGDDMPDIPAMQMVALPCCPQNAVPQVKDVSAYVSHKNGGDGCARDIIEQVLKVRGDWEGNFSAKND